MDGEGTSLSKRRGVQEGVRVHKRGGEGQRGTAGKRRGTKVSCKDKIKIKKN